MTISTAASPLSYSGNGSTTAFAITWAYILKSHVVATLRAADGTETVQILNTDYTLTDPDATGTLTMTVAPASGETLVITLEPPNTQETDFPFGGPFPAKAVEDALDLLSQVSQKIQTLFNRALRVPKTDTRSGSELELPNETDRASKFLAFDTDGKPIVTAVAPVGGALVTPFAETFLDDLTAAAVRATLGAASASDSDRTSSGNPKNLGLAFSVGSSALTCAIKTAGGTNPTSTDKVSVPMRSLTAALGTFNTREITASLSLVISSGSTLGHANATAENIHWYVIDNAGVLELAASSEFIGMSGIVTTTAEGGAGGADSATTMYSTSARTSVPYQWVGLTVDTQSTAGTWAAVPTSTTLVKEREPTFVPPAGSIVQRVRTQSTANTTDTNTIPIDSTIPQNDEGTEFLTRTITPDNASNILSIRAVMSLSNSSASEWMIAALFQDSTVGALAAQTEFQTTTGSGTVVVLDYDMVAGTTSPTTFKIRCGQGTAGTCTMNVAILGAVIISSLTVTEHKV